MLKNHILLAFRHLKKEKGYALVSIMGLAIAFTVSFFAVAFLLHEWFPDGNFADRDRLFRLNSSFTLTEENTLMAMVPLKAAETLAEKLPEFEKVIPIESIRGAFNMEVDSKTFKVDKCVLTNTGFPQLFKADLFSLQQPFEAGTILLSSSTSEAIFGHESPIGQVVKTSRGDFVVAGTFEDFPSNSHLQINAAAIPLPSAGLEMGDGLAYVRLLEGTSISQVEQKLPLVSKSLEDAYGPFSYSLESADKIYDKGSHGFVLKGINKSALQVVLIVSAIILLISATNIVNHTQLKGLFRGREVGVRKVLGISKLQLLFQFFTESLVVVALSLLLALSMVQVLASDVYMYLKVTSVNQPAALSILVVIALAFVLLLTFSQAYLFAGIMPRKAMAGNYSIGSKKHVAKVMIGFQFLITTMLVGGALLVRSQMNYIANKPLGFDVDGLWYVYSGQDSVNLQLLKDELGNTPEIASSTISSAIPGSRDGYFLTVYQFDKHRENLSLCKVDKDYFDTYGIQFKEEPASLTATGYLLNEKGAWLEKELNGRFKIEGTLLGVVGDFHTFNLKQPIDAIKFKIEDQTTGYLTVRIASDKEDAAKRVLAEKWTQLYPETPFELYNLKDQFIASHAFVTNFLTVVNALTIVSIFISCVGLSALSAFSIKKRLKEVAIRKVLGATIFQIAKSVNLGFVLIISGSALAAIPIVNKFGNDWLDGFAYHTQFDLWLQALPGFLVLALSLGIITVKTWNTAKSNPIEALRTE
jgi:putative ABC transport system permease protein